MNRDTITQTSEPSNRLLDAFFTPAAGELSVHPRTLRKWDELGIGAPKTQIGRLTLYRKDSVRVRLESREQRRMHGGKR